MTRRFLPIFTFISLSASVFVPLPIKAQEPVAEAASLHDEIKLLRQTIEMQSKQIQILSDQVARLSVQIEMRAAGAPPPARNPEFIIPAARPLPVEPPSNVHILVKGDSLDKIARQYNVTIADLLKLNKISDPKKLQIGQQIILPPTSTPATTPQ